MNLNDQIRNIQELFGQRNAMYVRGQCLFYLMEAHGVFAKHIRKGSPKPHLESSLASLFRWVCAVAGEFKDLPVIEAMCEKFPAGRCAYCGDPVCTCHTAKRKDITLAVPDAGQLEWSANQWTENLMSVYGEGNRERGMQFVLGRLCEEICETSNAQLLGIHRPNTTLSDIRKDVSHEIADIFSWILVIAGLLEIDIDAVLTEKYGGLHYRCGARPCNCGPHYAHYDQSHPYIVRRVR